MESIVIVSTAASSRDLTTVARMKTELSLTGSTYDTLLGYWVTESSDAITAYVGRPLMSEVVSEYFRLRDIMSSVAPFARPLTLSRWPVSGVSVVSEGSTTLVSGDYSGTTAEYEYVAKTGLIYRMSSGVRIAWASANVVVAYTGGYLTGDPALSSLGQACIAMVRHRWAARDRDPMVKRVDVPGVLSEEYWVGAVGQNGALPPEVLALIDPFRSVAP